MRVLIIEDEPLAAERLAHIIGQYDPSMVIAGVEGSIESARAWLNTKPLPDLVFMDIELGDGKCFPILDLIQNRCPVIFTTAYDQFALQAIQHLCIDYLLKPISTESLARAMQKFHAFFRQEKAPSYKQRFLVKNGLRMQFVEVSEVSYFFADGKQTFLVRNDGSRFMIDHTLEKLEQLLDKKLFFRFSRKIIGAVHAIRDIRTHDQSRIRIALHAGNQTDEALVSRERVPAFRQWAELQ